MGMTIRLALAALALALAVLGPLAAQAVTVTWATDAKRSGGGPADAKPVAPDARAGSSRPLASGRGASRSSTSAARSPDPPSSARRAEAPHHPEA